MLGMQASALQYSSTTGPRRFARKRCQAWPLLLPRSLGETGSSNGPSARGSDRRGYVMTSSIKNFRDLQGHRERGIAPSTLSTSRGTQALRPNLIPPSTSGLARFRLHHQLHQLRTPETQPSFASTSAIALEIAASTSIRLVSSRSASLARANGAAARPASRSSRALISIRTSS